MAANIKTFDDESEKYSLNRPKYPKEIYEYINAHCRLHDVAWDCACGNGQVAVDLVKYFDKIEASDKWILFFIRAGKPE